MMLTSLLTEIAGDEQFASIVRALRRVREGKTFALEGVPAAARPVVIAALARELDRPLLVVASRQDAAARLHDSLGCYLAQNDELLLWPAQDALPYEQLPFDPVAAAARLGTLDRLLRARDGEQAGGLVLVASARGLQGQLMPPAALREWRQEWRVGDQLDIGETLSRWIEGGYEPVTSVEEPGQFSRRGGLIDVWAAGTERPVRIELFGDEIDSLRPFDPATQRSSGRLPTVTILPASELPLWARDAALERLQAIDASTLRPEVEQEWRRMLTIIERGEAPPAPDLLAPYFSERPASLLDYLPAEAIVVFDEPGAVRLAAEQVEAQAEELR